MLASLKFFTSQRGVGRKDGVLAAFRRPEKERVCLRLKQILICNKLDKSICIY